VRLNTLGTERYPALTGVRALGASAVFFDHFSPRPDLHIVINTLAFFFVLSGFLIARIYYEKVQLSRDWWTKYLVNRYARIYPVYFLLLTAAVVCYHQYRPLVLATNYTLTHALFRGMPLIIQPSWSLTVEECFYALAPILMVLARRYHVLAPLVLGCALLLTALAISALGTPLLGSPRFVFTTTFFGHFFEFFAGFYLALMILKRERAGARPSSGCRCTLAGLAGAVVLSWVMVRVYRHTPLNVPAIIVINNFLIPVPIALLYWGLVRERTPLSAALSTRLAGWLGRSSYSFYLLQVLVIDFVGVPLLRLLGSRLWSSLAAFVLTWVIAGALFVLYEEPLNLAIRRLLGSATARIGIPTTLYQPNS
jgi:peptidoglycan/LPS O-acetylase OafA/YrhL